MKGTYGHVIYLYKRDNQYYYIEIAKLSFLHDGEYSSRYKYKAHEVFYSIKVQNCNTYDGKTYWSLLKSSFGPSSDYLVIRNNKNSLELLEVL